MDKEKEKRAIEYLKMFEPKDEPYYLCYSGGKDSDVILALAKLAGVKFEAVHNLTTVDAPETVRYVKSQPDVRIDIPDTTMWKLIAEKRMPPTRLVRYCCEELKERGGRCRKKITGVRWAESVNRKANGGFVNILGKEKTMKKLAEEAGVDYEENKKGAMVLNNDNAETRAFVDHCYRTTSVMVNPIVDWTDEDVWSFLYHYGIKSNPLYKVEKRNSTYIPTGCKRIGCIGCPMRSGKVRKAEFIKYPKYRDNYLRAFRKMQDKRIKDGLEPFGDELGEWTAKEIMMWWVGDNPNQLSLFGEPEYLKGAKLR